MAAAADISGDVLELGPGSGVFTAALLTRGLAPARLTAIEYDGVFAKALRTRFPGICILQGNAMSFPALTGAIRFSSIVSGLPLLNYALADREALIESALAAMPKGAPFVQFSYGWNAPVPAPQNASVTLATRVWRNLPPAAVWLYRRA
jgi:phosphatidylethanolamine/phosphatidyl-N-methylethanolamine N-methyltransferase